MFLFYLLYVLAPTILAIQEDDKVTNLPGLTFQINYNLYSGYLNANQNGTWKMHYWLIESKSNPATDPVLVWFQGGPGCSSFGGAFEELGPFYINYDAQTLFENKYSWNAKANVLFLESPIGVGFSFDTENPEYSVANDEQSAEINYRALSDFFNRVQPKYANRSFFLSGESYAGVYIPMLSAKLTEGINSKDFPNSNFAGAAIGNGFMNVQKLFNALVLWGAYHAKVSLNDWNEMKQKCRSADAVPFDVDNYNFFQYLKSTNGMDYVSDGSRCGDLVASAISVPDPNDAYNFYQDCYNPDFLTYNDTATGEFGDSMDPHSEHPALRHRRKRSVNLNPFVNTASLFNYDSSDNQLGYPCWNWIVTRKYANRADVQQALHIDPKWQDAGDGKRRRWKMCNNPMYAQYNMTYPDQESFFNYTLQNTKNPNFRFLIYNGDADTVCNYLGDSWFIQKTATDNLFLTNSTRGQWTYRGQTAGFVQRFSRTADNVVIDVVTVKGAGHMVPNDRPAQSVQMITNFMLPQNGQNGLPDYNSVRDIDPTPNLAGFNSPTASTTTTTTVGSTTSEARATDLVAISVTMVASFLCLIR